MKLSKDEVFARLLSIYFLLFTYSMRFVNSPFFLILQLLKKFETSNFGEGTGCSD